MRFVTLPCLLLCMSLVHGQTTGDPQIEREKLDIQRQTLAIEKDKARWTAVTSTVPILAALATVIYGVWSLRKTAAIQLTTKLAELAMEGPGPVEIVTRARIVNKLFAGLLPEGFESRIATIEETELRRVGPASTRKIELLRLVTEHPNQRDQIRRDHLALWGHDPLRNQDPS